MSKEFVKKCYEELAKIEPIQYVPSSLNYTDIKKIQEKYAILFPQIYIDFISTYAHSITNLYGKLDNFLFEDDVDVTLEISAQPYQKELQQIDLLFESNIKLLNCDYLPIGVFEGYNLLYWNLKSGKIYFIDEDDYYECDTKESMKEKSILLFDTFEQLLECFFLKKIYVCHK
ncbi:MAG: hypothetical protein Q4D45_03705 [Lachnospiraceae bacterium]|nr:hypothetical protein [Lachnospiraceae bacterium]